MPLTTFGARLAATPSGKFLVLGSPGSPGSQDLSRLALEQFNADGTVDTSFGDPSTGAPAGTTYFDIGDPGGGSTDSNVVVDKNGRISLLAPVPGADPSNPDGDRYDTIAVRLTPDGLELIEIAPGVDLERDVLAHVGFTPINGGEPKLMDERLFRDEPIGLKDDLLTVPLEARFSYDAERNIFFLNLEGVSVSSAAEAEAIVAEIEKRLAAVGKKVPVAVNYDNFYLAPDLADTYASAVRGLAERYYESVTRYTTSSFMRLKLSGHLSDRGLAPHIYESRQEALEWLNK